MWIIFFLSSILLAYWLYEWWQTAAVKRWSRQLDLNIHNKTFEKLFQNVNGFALSRQARAKQDAMEYTYGEIEFIPFIALLSLVPIDKDTVFYDLGSGTGKAVLACSMVFAIKKSCGIELFDVLHKTSLEQKNQLLQLPSYQKNVSIIEFIHNNFLHADFSDATLIFINATALFGETWDALQVRLGQQKLGTIIITTSKKLSKDEFILKKETQVQMSWGVVKAYIQVKI